ncbi:MAG: gliding motility-associated C-terminal domain-containing protein [Cryomorphaceae bacterium]
MRFLLTFVFFTMQLVAFSQYWVKYQGGDNTDETLAIASDDADNTYTTGYFSTAAEINGQNLGVVGLTDMFLSKIDADGDSEWSISAGGSGSDRGLGVDVDGAGNVLVCGFFTGSMNFGNGVSITSNGNSRDIFVAKYNANGIAQWARAAGSAGNNDRANGVAADNSGNVFITGEFSGDADFGGLTISSLGGTTDAFVAKYSADGSEEWVKKGSGDTADRGLALVADNQGDVYACGTFSGEITFDNTYTNTIQNALFLVKYSADGDEAWVRWAGGSSQSIAYDIDTDGSEVFITGDFGESITFFSEAGTNVLNSAYDNSVFVVNYSGSGAYQWGQSQGSGSPVSARGISYRNNTLGITGFHECTFESLSEIYGESLFNSIGFRDAFVMRYTSSGNFDWARNFGSHSDETPTGITVLNDGIEVITGVFTGDLIFTKSGPVDGEVNLLFTPNSDLNYCDDPSYGEFGRLAGPGQDDGFTIKIIDLNREPYDFYQRFTTDCDLSIPDVCIGLSASGVSETCYDSLIGCPPYNIFAINQIRSIDNRIGYEYNVTWTPPQTGSFSVNAPGDVTATITSQDGCYVETASAYVDIYPPAETPLISDNLDINIMANNTQSIQLCPGETVDIWADFPEGYTFNWSGFNVDDEYTNSDTVVVDSPGNVSIAVTNEFGCTATNSVFVNYIELPPEVELPYLVFNTSDDTVRICENNNALVSTFNGLNDSIVESEFFDWTWSASPSGSISGGSSAGLGVDSAGWYTVEVEFFYEDNICVDDTGSFTATDSIYVMLFPNPETFLNVDGPEFVCAGDTFTVYLDYSGNFDYNIPFSSDLEEIEFYGDSLLLTGSGFIGFTVDSLNEFNCASSSTGSLNIETVSTPEILVLSESAVICPGDSVQLATDSPGEILWQGPGLQGETGESIYVTEPGLYFTEVTFYEGCALVSNTLEVAEYATPFISGMDGVLCPDDSLEISIVSTANTQINWLDPLSGSDSVQVVTQPGIYTAEVSSCGITSEVSIEVQLSTDELVLEQPDTTPVCEGDSILITATPGYESYEWSGGNNGEENYYFESGVIQATAVSQYGCELISNPLEIDFNPLPPSPSFEFDLVCEGELQTVEVNAPFSLTYVDSDGNEIQSDPIFEIPNFTSDTVIYAFLYSEFCTGPIDSVLIGPKPFPDVPIIATDAPVCTGTALNLVVLNSDGASDYIWITPTGSQPTGSDINYQVADMDSEGIYQCYANLSDCLSDTTSIEVELFETRQVQLPPDTGLCMRPNFTIRADTTYMEYLWQDGSSDSLFQPEESGTFTLVATDYNGCQSFDEMTLELVDCSLIIPNVFTPNGDGQNDNWQIFLEQPLYYELVIYNRWGRKVFETIDSGLFGMERIIKAVKTVLMGCTSTSLKPGILKGSIWKKPVT